MTHIRYFDFDPAAPLWEAVCSIRAALDDEGLALTESDNGTASGITSVIVPGDSLVPTVKRVLVPEHRIVPKEARS